MPMRGWRARIVSAARSPSSLIRGRHADVDERDVRLVGVDGGYQLVSRPGLCDDVKAREPHDRRDPFAYQQGVVGDHDAHR